MRSIESKAPVALRLPCSGGSVALVKRFVHELASFRGVTRERRARRETLAPERLPGLEDELILCYSGRSRASAINNWEIYKRLFNGDRALLEIFNEIGSAAEQCAQAVRDGDLAKTIFLSQREWQLRVSDGILEMALV